MFALQAHELATADSECGEVTAPNRSTRDAQADAHVGGRVLGRAPSAVREDA